MKITIELPGGGLDLLVTAAPDATVDDLLRALQADGWADLPATATVRIDGREAPVDHALAEVGCRDGAVIAVTGSVAPDPAIPTTPDAAEARLLAARGGRAPDAVAGDGRASPGATAGPGSAVDLVVAGGLDAGRRRPLAPGRHRIGRGPDAALAHPALQDRHATLDVEASGRTSVTDHGTRLGTWCDGHPTDRGHQLEPGMFVRTGPIALRVDRPVGDRPTTTDGPFNRPPRPAAPPDPAALSVPTADHHTRDRPTLPIASVLGGIAMGGAMWAMTGRLTYAMLAFVSPMLGVLTAVAARRRHGRDDRSRSREQRRALLAFAGAVSEASRQATSARRAVHPDLGEVVRRATAPSTRLWERRSAHADAFHLVVGHGAMRWRPPLQAPTGGQAAAEVEEVLAHEAWLRDVPVVAPGGVIGIVGPRPAALALARGLVAQAVVHHGPADLDAVLVTPDALAWDGAKWLPHLQDPVAERPRVADPQAGRDLLRDLVAGRRARDGDGTALLAVLDGVEVCEGRDAPGRAVLRGEAGPVLGVVLATSVDRLPSSCDTVVLLDGPDGAARVVRPTTGEVVRNVLVQGLSEPTLARVGRALARFEDPEAAGDRDLPAVASLADLLAADGPVPTTADGIRARWRAQRQDGRLRVPVGATTDGPLVVDLGRDGPHALVAGTTGAGKSELLRSLVAGLAAGADPDHVAFVLVDYKGGAAFDRCADLPHVVGMVTDLDDDLAERALTCLQAELHHRERRLRSVGVGDLDGWRRTPQGQREPLPDLVVVIDEFATLAAELPDFLDALVGVAQRGRSLGVHLVLATQRPAGVVSDDIRANTNLRIALRVQDRQDSTDVIEDPAAATLARDQPGRAFVRLGPGAVVPLQAALVTGPLRRGVAPVVVEPLALVGAPADASTTNDGPTELEAVVSAVRDAFAAEGLTAPRQPWPEPLPARIELAELTASQSPAGDGSSSDVVAAIADDPARQRRVTVGWDLDAGSLLLVGALGSGTTSALACLAMAAAGTRAPDDLHVHVLDAGRGGLADLDGLPHVSGVVRLGQQERVARLVRRLADEVDRRRAGQAGPRTLLLVDDWEAFATAHDLGPAAALLDDLARVVVEGPGVGIVTAVAVGRPGGVGARLLASFDQRWVFRLPDDADAAGLGVRGTAGFPPGRAVDTRTGLRLQVGHVPDLSVAVAEVARQWAGTTGPAPVEVLPTRVSADDLPGIDSSGPAWTLPVGIRGDDLTPACLHLHPAEHALVAGPSRSGRSTVLVALATAGVAAGLDVVVAAPRPSSLLAVPGVRVVQTATLPSTLASPDERRRLVLVDDADLVEVPGMEAALGAAPDWIRLVAAARTDAVRSAYGHWLRTLARSRSGLLLSPDPDLDGDLLGTRLPRHPMAPPSVGRGHLVDAGASVQCQAALPATGAAPSLPRASTAPRGHRWHASSSPAGSVRPTSVTN